MTYSDKLVTLYLISPFNIEPTPDKSLLGRLDRVLRSVGAGERIAVRSRMITAVASTKFKTKLGHPVSLVGLHGKDELLVVGPTWAIERLAAGQQPDDREGLLAENASALKFREILEAEIFWMLQVPRLLNFASNPKDASGRHFDVFSNAKSSIADLISAEYWERIVQKVPHVELDQKLNPEVASGMLGLLLRASTENISNFFISTDPTEFAISRCKEACLALAELDRKAEDGFDNHPIWWSQWLDKKEKGGPPPPATSQEILLTRYLAQSVNLEMQPRPRQESVHTKWLLLTEA